MTMRGDRLGGQDSGAAYAGNAGSSPARPTKRQRAALWARLRRLDRAISRHDAREWLSCLMGPDGASERARRRHALDAQRRDVRADIKRWWD